MPDLSDREQQLLDNVSPGDIRYIKLGRKNAWAQLAWRTQTLRLGFREIPHDLALTHRWTEIEAGLGGSGKYKTKGARTQAMNQVREFYELPERTLWLTFVGDEFWWCFAETQVEWLFDGDRAMQEREAARQRRVMGSWHKSDAAGAPLLRSALGGRLTKVTAFQGTICVPDGAEYALRKIRATPSETHRQADKHRLGLIDALGQLISELDPADFELLVELIFSGSGWRRITALGGSEETYDLALSLPTTGERALVQVKAQTSRSVLNSYLDRLDRYSSFSRFFFVYHTANTELCCSAEKVTVWDRRAIAHQVCRSGLIDWLLDRTA